MIIKLRNNIFSDKNYTRDPMCVFLYPLGYGLPVPCRRWNRNCPMPMTISGGSFRPQTEDLPLVPVEGHYFEEVHRDVEKVGERTGH